MSARSTLSVIATALIAASLMACGGGGGGGTKPDVDRPPPIHEDLKTTNVGRPYVSEKVVVTKVDRSRLSEGVVSISVRNRSDEYLSDLAYEVTLYYRNQDPKSEARTAMPFIPETTRKRRLDLDAKEEATITVRKGELSPGASDVFLRIRAEKPEPTRKGDTFLSDQVTVVGIDRDWFANPPSVKYTVRNDGDIPLRLQFKVLLIKDGEVVDPGEWTSAPGLLEPGKQLTLEPDLTGRRVLGALPALKVKRPMI